MKSNLSSVMLYRNASLGGQFAAGRVGDCTVEREWKALALAAVAPDN